MKRLLLVIVLCAFMSSPAFADLYGTIDVKFINVDPGQTVSILASSNGAFGITAGVYNIEVKNSTWLPPYNLLGDGTDTPFAIEAFCTDLWDDIPTDFVLYDVRTLDQTPDAGAGPMGTTRAKYVAELLDNYWTATLTKNEAAALQLAVWEVIDEGLYSGFPGVGGLDITTDTFQVDAIPAVKNRANEMLTNLTTGVDDFNLRYAGLYNSTGTDPKGDTIYQDFVVHVPIPAAVLLGILGLGVAGLGLGMRRFA